MELHENHTNIPESIADQFCKQLTAFQFTIECRGEDLCFPSPQELNMQTKMINNVIKIKKHNATDYVSIAMKRFLKFIAATDKQMAKTVDALYAQFSSGNGSSDAKNTADNSPLQPTPDTPELTPAQELNVSLQDFKENEQKLLNYALGNEHSKILFQGRYVNKYWLEYNLTQFTLPSLQRKFITEANFRYTWHERHQIEEQIRHHLKYINS